MLGVSAAAPPTPPIPRDPNSPSQAEPNTFPPRAVKIGSGNLGTDGYLTFTLWVSSNVGLRLLPSTNVSYTTPNLVGGSNNNLVAPGVAGAFIGGGGGTVANAIFGTGSFSTIGGGAGNFVGGSYNTVGGGYFHDSYGNYSSVGGGYNNGVYFDYGTIAGGQLNRVHNSYGAIGGGYNNVASGYASTIPGGYNNQAAGNSSLAAGYNAKALHDGSFVWSDYYTGTALSVASTATNQFIARAVGGFYFYTDPNLNDYCRLSPGGGQWYCTSDRNTKTNILPINRREILDKLMKMPVSLWSYQTEQANVRHIGPMAQDFYEVFGLGDSDKQIGVLDSSGVALAAIQGLYQEVEQRDLKIKGLEERINQLEKQVVSPSVVSVKESSAAEGDPLARYGLLALSLILLLTLTKARWQAWLHLLIHF
jgi:hypothetical protein